MNYWTSRITVDLILKTISCVTTVRVPCATVNILLRIMGAEPWRYNKPGMPYSLLVLLLQTVNWWKKI